MGGLFDDSDGTDYDNEEYELEEEEGEHMPSFPALDEGILSTIFSKQQVSIRDSHYIL